MTDLDTIIGTASLDKPIRVASSSTLREVASRMEDSGVSCLLVGMSTAWLVTDHDLAGALAAGLDAEAPVEEIVVKTPVWATESTSLVDAVNMMINHGIRHLLVLAATGETLGVLSLATATKLLVDRREPRVGHSSKGSAIPDSRSRASHHGTSIIQDGPAPVHLNSSYPPI
jgi:signal-transduction protein with cAMP-binding, CBS, and nucleotidyltransferase domain